MSEEPGVDLASGVTYLIGSRRAFENYCRDRNVSPWSRHVRHVWQGSQLRGISGGQIIFLHGWTDLPDWKDLHEYVSYLRAIGRCT